MDLCSYAGIILWDISSELKFPCKLSYFICYWRERNSIYLFIMYDKKGNCFKFEMLQTRALNREKCFVLDRSYIETRVFSVLYSYLLSIPSFSLKSEQKITLLVKGIQLEVFKTILFCLKNQSASIKTTTHRFVCASRYCYRKT